MGQEREYGSLKVGNTAAARKVIDSNGTTTLATDKPPRYAAPGDPQAGHYTTNLSTTALLVSVGAGGSGHSVGIDLYVWSHIAEEWFRWKTFNVGQGETLAEYLSVGLWDGMQFVLHTNAHTLQVDAWCVKEAHFETIGATLPAA